MEALLNSYFPNKDIRNFESPKLNAFCFHGAGMECNVFTNKGTNKNPMKNELLDFCKDENINIYSCQLPGRGTRYKEAAYTTVQEFATDFVAKFESLFKSDYPYVFIAHSMGALCAYELLHELKRNRLELPRYVFFSCMLSPDTAENERPWKVSATLSASEFKEEAKSWDINEQVFEPTMWSAYEPILRNDFKLFDTYNFNHAEVQPLGVSASCYCADHDHKIKKPMMDGWQNLLNASNHTFEIVQLDANHNFLYSLPHRSKYYEILCKNLDGILLDIEYGS